MRSLIILLIIIKIDILSLTLNEVIEDFNSKSRFVENQRLERQQYIIKEEGIYNEYDREIGYSLSALKEYGEDGNIGSYENREQALLSLKQDIYYYEILYNFSEYEKHSQDERGLLENRFGIRKVINDINYSQEKYEKNTLEVEMKILDYRLGAEYLEEVEKLIDIYANLYYLTKQLEVGKRLEREYKDLLAIAREKLEVGEGVELGVDYIFAEKLEEEINIMNLKKQLQTTLNRLENKTNTRYQLLTIELPDTQDVLVRADEHYLKIERENLTLQIEELKLRERQDQNELIISGDYDTKRNLWTVSVALEGDILGYPREVKEKKVDIAIYKNKIMDLEEEVQVEVKLLYDEYNNLLNQEKIKRLKKNNRDKTVEIAKEMYKVGYINAKDLIDEEREGRDAYLEHIKALNNLKVFKYKMKIRGEQYGK